MIPTNPGSYFLIGKLFVGLSFLSHFDDLKKDYKKKKRNDKVNNELNSLYFTYIVSTNYANIIITNYAFDCAINHLFRLHLPKNLIIFQFASSCGFDIGSLSHSVTRTPVRAVLVQAYVRFGSRTIRSTRFIA